MSSDVTSEAPLDLKHQIEDALAATQDIEAVHALERLYAQYDINERELIKEMMRRTKCDAERQRFLEALDVACIALSDRPKARSRVIELAWPDRA